MKKKRFILELREVWHQKVAVLADTLEEAQGLATSGEAIVIDEACQYSHTLDSDPIAEAREATEKDFEEFGEHFWADQEE